jgi:pilus assembly protein CpaC
MLKVRFSEVNRDIGKTIATNIIANSKHVDVAQGNVNSDITKIIKGAAGTSFFFSGALAGLNIFSSLDLAETDGYATTLAEPTLTALSGETASFLAGGEIPIPVPQYQGVTTIEYKQYGVSLSFTPTVLADGRISLRVRPEVSQLSSSTIAINGYQIPGLTTRRAETTVELGSGQSFVIGGLLSNNASNSVDKAPFLGDLPIIGQLFRSSGFKKSQSELIIVVTPYLVKPLGETQVALPTDGYRSPTDGQLFLMNRAMDGKTGETPRRPIVAPPVTAAGAPIASLPDADRPKPKPGDAAPGFSYN